MPYHLNQRQWYQKTIADQQSHDCQSNVSVNISFSFVDDQRRIIDVWFMLSTDANEEFPHVVNKSENA